MSTNAQPTKKLFTYDTVEPQPPSYLWEPYLTENNVNLVFGAGGSGKTMLVCALIAALTSGNHPPEMPGVLPGDPVNAIYFGSEDDAENYSYRLLKCGADRARVFSVPESDMPGLIATGAIREYISEARAKLIVFDPIQAFLPAGADMNSTSEMRPLMNGLREICREMKCRIVSLPGDQATIRGYSGVTLILEDEASQVSDELYQAIQPMLIVNKGQFIAMTTPFGKRGHFYSEWMTGGEDWKRIEVQAAQCPRITPDELEKQKRSMGEMFFRQEFMCEFVDDAQQTFKHDLIERAFDDSIKPLF